AAQVALGPVCQGMHAGAEGELDGSASQRYDSPVAARSSLGHIGPLAGDGCPMVPSDFNAYFSASATAAAALVGLLFVAISLAPESTVARSAPLRRRAIAVSAFTGLLNAFFIS